MNRRDDEVIGQILRLDGLRWSFNNRAPCDQEVFLRPCQTGSTTPEIVAPYPHAAPCRTSAEMVLVVDDDADMRQELIDQMQLLGYPATGCSSGAELKAVAGRYTSGCILLDIGLPDDDGLTLHKWLRANGVALPVVHISGRHDLDEAIEGLKDGATDFLKKPFSNTALHQAVTSAVGQSRKRYCRHESKRMVTALFDRLSPTERRVAEMIARGYSTKLIADELGRSENTIKIHRQRVFVKLRVNSAASIANLWYQLRTIV